MNAAVFFDGWKKRSELSSPDDRVAGAVSVGAGVELKDAEPLEKRIGCLGAVFNANMQRSSCVEDAMKPSPSCNGVNPA